MRPTLPRGASQHRIPRGAAISFIPVRAILR
jgi:hypothetical protein